jgi:hypothetical protein
MTTLLSAIVPCIVVALAAPAQSPATARNAKSAVVQPKSEPPSQPTAEDVLRALKHRRPVNDVIPPGSRAARDAVARNPTASDQLLLPEGLSVVGRTGRLSSEGQWWIFAFDDDASLPPMKLLPNANLELMVGTLRGASVPVRFTVTGELTVFEGENFLLPRTALRAAGDADTPAQKGDAVPSPPRVPPDATAEDVLAAMQALQPKEAILPLGATASDEKGRSRSAGYSGSFMSDGSPLMNRVGRLVRQGSWWTFVSDSDRPEQPEPPLRLLPNQGVELMVREPPRGGGVFIVSGEVTSFDGENYLLTRVATRRVDTGNLRK